MSSYFLLFFFDGTFKKVLQKTNKILPFAAAAAYGSQEDEKEVRIASQLYLSSLSCYFTDTVNSFCSAKATKQIC